MIILSCSHREGLTNDLPLLRRSVPGQPAVLELRSRSTSKRGAGAGSERLAIAGGCKAKAGGEMEMKTCTKCKLEKPLTAFPLNKSRTDGHGDWCKQCCTEHWRKKSGSVPLEYRSVEGTWEAAGLP